MGVDIAYAAYELAQAATGGSNIQVNVLYPPSGLAAMKGDGVTNDTTALQAIIAYVSGLGGGIIKFPSKPYLITPGISIPSNIWFVGEGNAKLITKSTTRYNVMMGTDNYASNIKFIGLTFDQTGDTHGAKPDKDTWQGCHILHIPDSDDIEISNCTFYGYGITCVLSQPHVGSGNRISVHDCIAYWERQVTTEYDVSVFNLDALIVDCYNNKVIATRKAGVTYWKPETAFEVHMPAGCVVNNEIQNCKNGILHVAWPMLYTVYDNTVVGGVQITGNRCIGVLCGVSCWGAHTLAGVITRNLIINDNYINGHLGGCGYKPANAISFDDGSIDASFFRNISIKDNHIKFTWTKYVSGASEITFGTNTITTTGDDFKDLNVGDYIIVSGCTVNTGNNKAATITAATDKVLTFAAGTFTAGAETAAITVQIHVVDFMSSAVSSLYTSAIKGVTNNSIQDMDITGNIIESWPYSGVALRALQARGTNLHRRVKIYDNKFLDCAFIPPAASIWQGVFVFEECADVDIRFNKVVKGGVANITCIKLLSFGDSNLTNIRFIDNDCSTLTAREAEYESLSVLQANLTTDLYEFIALGCLPSNTQPQVLTASANVFTINMAKSMLRNARATIADNVAKTISVTNPQVGCEIYLELVHTDGNGITYTMSSGSSIVWLDGAAPTLTDGKTYRFSFVYAAINVWHGHCVGGW